MKGHKIAPKCMNEKAEHLMRKRGGEVSRDDDGPEDGTDEAEEDVKSKPERRNNSAIESDAEEMKAKRGGALKKKRVGKVEGEKHRAHGGRAARKSGGGCEASPFSSARQGTAATGRKLEKETMD
jgi:hypothetical protein